MSDKVHAVVYDSCDSWSGNTSKIVAVIQLKNDEALADFALFHYVLENDPAVGGDREKASKAIKYGYWSLRELPVYGIDWLAGRLP